jgi:hypothetical protein
MMSDNLSVPVEYEDENFKKTSVQIMIKETAAKSESASYSDDGRQGGENHKEHRVNIIKSLFEFLILFCVLCVLLCASVVKI